MKVLKHIGLFVGSFVLSFLVIYLLVAWVLRRFGRKRVNRQSAGRS